MQCLTCTCVVGVPHRVTQDDTYNGYFIPAGTNVIANIWYATLHRPAVQLPLKIHLFIRGISQDPQYFPFPSEFNPNRYCDSNSPALDPRDFVFGFGRRICPGIHLAHRAIWINVASILWGFNIRSDDPPRPKVMDVTQYMDINQLRLASRITWCLQRACCTHTHVCSAPYPFACDITPRWDGVAEKVAEAIAERTAE